MQITVSGSKDFARFGEACLRAARVDFDREMNRGLRETGEDIATAVRSTTDNYMPSGYEETLASRLLTQVEIPKAWRGVTVTFYAKGKSGRRDVERLDLGVLKHPVYGRFRTLKSGARQANPWAVTKIRPGFVTVPVKLRGPAAAQKRLGAALDRIFDGIEKTS